MVNLEWGHQSCPWTNLTYVLIERDYADIDTVIQGRCHVKRQEWIDRHKDAMYLTIMKLGRRQGTESPLQPSERSNWQSFDFGNMTSRITRWHQFLLLFICGTGLWQLEKISSVHMVFVLRRDEILLHHYILRLRPNWLNASSFLLCSLLNGAVS